MKLKRLVPQDYSRLKPFFTKQRYELSAYSLASILAWSNQAYRPCGAVTEDSLIVSAEFTDPALEPYLVLPISATREYTPEELHALAQKLDYGLMQFVPGDYIDRYGEKRIAGLFRIQAHAEYNDYIYQTQDLARLKGNKYSKKRNLIHQFKREYVKPGRVQVEDITEAATSECLEFLEEWCREHDCDRNPAEDLACEKQAAINTLENFEAMEMKGLLVRIDGRVNAFGIAATLTAEMGVLQYEKALGDVKGLYQFLDCQCAQRLFRNRPLINKESDMGLPGIAQAKKSYHPTRIVKAYQLFVQ
jgi:hypothetical protein